jgi:uncharacterized membrane protein YeaQ/YmgE (transglycosylase-associated protein family)
MPRFFWYPEAAGGAASRLPRSVDASTVPSAPEVFIDMSIISAIIIGLLVGAVAKLLMPGKDPGGWIITILLGLAGSIVGTYAGQAMNLYREGEPAGFIASVLGAMLLLFIYRLATRRHAPR